MLWSFCGFADGVACGFGLWVLYGVRLVCFVGLICVGLAWTGSYGCDCTLCGGFV